MHQKGPSREGPFRVNRPHDGKRCSRLVYTTVPRSAAIGRILSSLAVSFVASLNETEDVNILHVSGKGFHI